jgi:antitoxin component YwqK of YwqJK toxin-antitoxin module
MIKFLLAFGLLLIVLTGIAQKDSVRKYLDANLQFVSRKEAVFPAMAIKDNDHWELYAVYPDTNILLNVYYKDAALTIKDGPFILYHPKKIIAQRGYFIDNRARGHWQSFYSDGQKKDEGDIVNNHFSGVWKEWYQNGIPKSIRTYVYNDSMISGQPVHENSPATKVSRVVEDLSLEGKIDGAVSTWYENGNKESEVNYHNDSLSGTCKWYRPNGKPSSTEVYTNGKVTDLNCYDDEGNYSGSTCSISKLPVFINPVYSAEDYVENELHKEKHRGVTAYGEVDIRFNITQKGTVENIVIASSPDATLSRLITVIVSKMTAWSPAVTHNRIISYQMKLIIPYYGDK